MAPDQKPGANQPVSWRSLPRKDQLVILTLARLAEPLTASSLQAYMYFMLRSFDARLSDAEISSQAGLLVAAFTAAQCVTAVWWGRVADREWMGRKNVLLVGLAGTLVSTVGFGFSRSFFAAMVFRCLGGALNGNVGVMRTMISEIIKEKKYQTKAFLILPVTFNIGILVGPLLGGWLQDPISLYPELFGPRSTFGGEKGIEWMVKYPYAFPNLINSLFFVFSIALVYFGLEETLVDRAGRPDRGIRIRKWMTRRLGSLIASRYGYMPLANASDRRSGSHELNTFRPRTPSPTPPALQRPRPKLPYRRIFTRNVVTTLFCHGLLHIHTSAFNNIWFLFLSTPRFDPAHPLPSWHTSQRLPFSFGGGLGLDPPTIGVAIGIIGLIGLTLQLGVYSTVTHRLGLLSTFRLSLLVCHPLVYALAPYLAVVPTPSQPPEAANGPLIWFCITLLLFVQVVGRTFILPIAQILVNNASPHPSVLGSVHGLGQSVLSGCRTLGPVVWSWLYGVGLDNGVVGLAWWVLCAEALATAAASLIVKEGSGHEILLEGD